MSTTLVTGGCGFIGTWVVRELLRRGEEVLVLDDQPAPARWGRVLGAELGRVRRVDAGLLDRDAIRDVLTEHQVARVLHLAALLTPACQHDPWLGCQVNVLGSTAVFDAARLAGTVESIAYTSSYAVYGDAAQGQGATADGIDPDPTRQRGAATFHPAPGYWANEPVTAATRAPSFYGAFKQAVDDIAEQYWRHYHVPSVAVRPHVVYGPEREVGLTAGPSLACRAAALGGEYVIGYTGLAGYDYVEDVAELLVRAAFECPPGSTIVDLPSERAVPEDFVDLITSFRPESAGRIRVAGPQIPANIPAAPRDVRHVFKGWQPTPLREGVRRTLEYYRRLA